MRPVNRYDPDHMEDKALLAQEFLLAEVFAALRDSAASLRLAVGEWLGTQHEQKSAA